MEKCGVLHFGSNNLCVQRLACRAISTSAELLVVLVTELAELPTETAMQPLPESLQKQVVDRRHFFVEPPSAVNIVLPRSRNDYTILAQ